MSFNRNRLKTQSRYISMVGVTPGACVWTAYLTSPLIEKEEAGSVRSSHAFWHVAHFQIVHESSEEQQKTWRGKKKYEHKEDSYLELSTVQGCISMFLKWLGGCMLTIQTKPLYKLKPDMWRFVILKMLRGTWAVNWLGHQMTLLCYTHLHLQLYLV